MHIESFFKIRKENNNKLIIDENLSNYKILTRKHLELHIKLSDLAELTKCYSYWIGGNAKFDIDNAFKKYMLCLNQIIDLALDSNYNLSTLNVEQNEYCLSDQFLNLFIDINDIIISSSQDHYKTLLEDYISLGFSLGLSEQNIIDEFKKINNTSKILSNI